MTTVNDAATLAELGTEQADARYAHIDRMSVGELAATMNDADTEVPRAVARALPQITAAIEALVPRLKNGGRLRYVGAGTAGRMAVVDASECPPTYGTPPEFVQAIMAGGPDALVLSTEGAEDDEAAGAAAMDDHGIGPDDVVIGIAASGRTPFAIAAVARARELGALTVGISCNTGTRLSATAEFAIEIAVGPEVVAGSTRLKSGTAQKLVLNMISTIAMVQLGKTYGNRMVDMQILNDKLAVRAARMVAEITGVDFAAAETALAKAGDNTKLAVLMIERGVDAETGVGMLAEAGGRLAVALGK
ncbi:N-acetylmuramic acid 6-phosphate etherase [Phytomonospora sp. NPDC050363]|uniref:N-acetylmuramic acid 6-phosphate etherase n=1 Tax=Phytomonospora sp. NPDC050363 TaxID=3155642 RepID=UPI0033D85BE6